jgi:hypothetical protein
MKRPIRSRTELVTWIESCVLGIASRDVLPEPFRESFTMKTLYRVLVYPSSGHHVIARVTGLLAIDCAPLTRKQARTLRRPICRGVRRRRAAVRKGAPRSAPRLRCAQGGGCPSAVRRVLEYLLAEQLHVRFEGAKDIR